MTKSTTTAASQAGGNVHTAGRLIPGENDVLYGRGYLILSHKGNMRFREMANTRRAEFASSKRIDKRRIANEIYDAIVSGLNGRFLTEDPARLSRPNDPVLERVWILADKGTAITKIMHRLREKEKPSKKKKTDEGAVSSERSMSGPAKASNAIQNVKANDASHKEDVLSLGGSDLDLVDLDLAELTQNQTANDLRDSERSLFGELDLSESSWRNLFDESEVSSNHNRSLSPASFGISHEAYEMGTAEGDDAMADVLDKVKLREWIDQSFNHQAQSIREHITRAIPVAIHIVQSCLDGGADEENSLNRNPPVASMHCGNVSLVVMDGDVKRALFSCQHDSNQYEGIRVHRLGKLGCILFELFSRQCPKQPPSSADPSLTRSMDLNSSSARPAKRKHLNEGYDADVSRLKLLQIPEQVCFLIRCLLECNREDFRMNESYEYFRDVMEDLILMRDNPSCYLDDPIVDSSNPTFLTRDKLCGRKEDVARIESLFMQRSCSGILVSGGAGAGKSQLAYSAMARLTSQTESYFFRSKFDQTKSSIPFSTVGSVFNQLCDKFHQNATESQSTAVRIQLEAALGSQVSILADILPSLFKIMSVDSCATSSEYVDRAMNVSFTLRTFIETVSCYSRRVSFLFDDVQFADQSSLRVLSNVLADLRDNGNVFFVFCHRDNTDDFFDTWLQSIAATSLQTVHLNNLNIDGVNELVSQSLNTFPRITRPLALALISKTQGNPLFLHQLLESLRVHGLISFNLNLRRWIWDMDKILNLEVSDSVLAFMVKEMLQLPEELRHVLKISACLGSSIKLRAFDILAPELNVDLRDLLRQVVEKGYILRAPGERIQFAHDKVQEAAYEMLTDTEKKTNHLNFGLILCLSVIDGDEDELFFLSMSQLNRGDMSSLPTPKRTMIAALNHKAGCRAWELSDFPTALSMHQQGIANLPDDHWSSEYDLSRKLHLSAVEASCSLNKIEVTKELAQVVVRNTRNQDDKLKVSFIASKCLLQCDQLSESREVSSAILKQMNEREPRQFINPLVAISLIKMKFRLEKMTNEQVLSMKLSKNQDRDKFLLDVYISLVSVMQQSKSSDRRRFPDLGLRMMDITLSNGLTPASCMAFTVLSAVFASAGKADLAYKLAKIALRLSEKFDSNRYRGRASLGLGGFVAWTKEPLRACAEINLAGKQYADRCGDMVASFSNQQCYIGYLFCCGTNLEKLHPLLKKQIEGALKLQHHFASVSAYGVYWTSQFLRGQHDEEHPHGLPSWNDLVLKHEGGGSNGTLVVLSHQYIQSFLLTKEFRGFPSEGFLNQVLSSNAPLMVMMITGIFFEGIVSFCRALSSHNRDGYKEGVAVLAFLKKWTGINRQTFENKYMLLEAMVSEFRDVKAEGLYIRAINLARKGQFIHEEGMAHELLGDYMYRRNIKPRAFRCYSEAMRCYRDWNAMTVVERLQRDIEVKFGSSAPMDT